MATLGTVEIKGFLSWLPEDVRARLSAVSVRKTYSDGQQIQSRGDTDTGFSIIMQGRVRVGTTGRSGGFVLLGILIAGNTFGEMAIYSRLPRVMDAIADGPVHIDFVPADKLRALVREAPDLADALLRVMALRQAMSLEHADDVLRLPLIQRLGRYLMRAHAISGREERIPVGQAELAEATASSRVSVSKSLSEMTRMGLIETGYGYVKLSNATAMEKWLADSEEVVRIRD